MPLSPAAEQVLKDIFHVGTDRALVVGNRLRAPTPGAEELFEFCEIIASKPGEERLQLYLEQHVGFLTGLLGGPDNSDLAVLFKPAIGSRFVADFCILQAHQGGAVAHFVEIETCHENLFTKDGRPAKRLADALKQLEDWAIEIEKSPVFFSKELVRVAEGLPLIGTENERSRGVRFAESKSIFNAWQGFGGFDTPFFTYTAILGRWSKLDADGKARIMRRNRQGGPKIHTFEQLARNANFRLERDDWQNDLDTWSDAERDSGF